MVLTYNETNPDDEERDTNQFIAITVLRLWELVFAFIQLYSYLRVYKSVSNVTYMFSQVLKDLKGFTLYFMLNVLFFALVNFILDAEITNSTNHDYRDIPKPLKYFFMVWRNCVGDP